MPLDARPPITGLDLDMAQGRPRVCCQVCATDLTSSESRRWGMGRHCRRKLGLISGRRLGRFKVEQEQLPGT